MTNRKTISPVEKQAEVTSMVERVARAIDPDAWEYIDRAAAEGIRNQVLRYTQLAQARAAIEAMREPTGKMVSAGVKHENWSDYGAVRSIYGAMIDAALKEEE